MSYASLQFLLFIMGLMIIYYICPKKFRWLVLLLGNIYFFVSLSGHLIIYCLLATLITYLMARLLEKSEKHKKRILILDIILVLLFLAILKYNNFLASLINPIIKFISLEISYKKFLMPIGISYYTLEMIAYIIDVYRGKCAAETNFLKLFTFFSYFPKLVEGPISRYTQMKEKMFAEHHFDYEKFKCAWVLIGYGFIKKLIIADRLGAFVDAVFKNNYPGLLLILAVISRVVLISSVAYQNFLELNYQKTLEDHFFLNQFKNFGRDGILL